MGCYQCISVILFVLHDILSLYSLNDNRIPKLLEYDVLQRLGEMVCYYFTYWTIQSDLFYFDPVCDEEVSGVNVFRSLATTREPSIHVLQYSNGTPLVVLLV